MKKSLVISIAMLLLSAKTVSAYYPTPTPSYAPAPIQSGPIPVASSAPVPSTYSTITKQFCTFSKAEMSQRLDMGWVPTVICKNTDTGELRYDATNCSQFQGSLCDGSFRYYYYNSAGGQFLEYNGTPATAFYPFYSWQETTINYVIEELYDKCIRDMDNITNINTTVANHALAAPYISEMKLFLRSLSISSSRSVSCSYEW